MASELPEDPREREILLRALREYSERCEPPQLTPDCPYSVDTEELGVRGCGEECMDLLGKHNAPRPSEKVDLGYRVVSRPRRPRARRQRPSNAYDARKIYLEDEASGPPRRWKLAAILVDLEDKVSKPPPEDPQEAATRREHINRLINVTEGRGLDFQAHVLPHLRLPVGRSVFIRLLMSRQGVEMAFDYTSGWAALADSYLDAAGQESTDRSVKRLLFRAVQAWTLTASVNDLMDWVPPSLPLLQEPPTAATEEEKKAEEDGGWIFERFTKTYLTSWSETALRKEWAYLHGQYHPPCLSLEMGVREVPESDLAKEMADRFATPRHQPQLADEMVEPAVKFLNEGRRLEASALFEAGLHIDPNSPNALNNLGFCLLPDDPKRALKYLDRAIVTGHGDVELINVNRMLALAMLGRQTSMLDLAADHLHRYADSGPRRRSWLWDIKSVLSGNDPKLIECRDLLGYAVEFLEPQDTA